MDKTVGSVEYIAYEKLLDKCRTLEQERDEARSDALTALLAKEGWYKTTVGLREAGKELEAEVELLRAELEELNETLARAARHMTKVQDERDTLRAAQGEPPSHGMTFRENPCPTCSNPVVAFTHLDGKCPHVDTEGDE